MENPPPDKREVDMWNVAAGCLAVAGILSREPGLTLAGLLIWAGRAYVARDSTAPEQPIDSLLQARRSLISLAIALLVLIAVVGPAVKNEDCAILQSSADYVAVIFLLLHLVSCWSLWRNFGVEERRKIAGASLGMLAVSLVASFAPSHSGCERHYAPSLLSNVLNWLVYLDDTAICIIAFFRSREEMQYESAGPLTVPWTIDRDAERKSDTTSIVRVQSRRVALGLVCMLTFLLIFKAFNGGLGQPQARDPEIIFSDFLNQVDKGQVAQVTIQGHSIQVQLISGEHFRTYAPDDTELIKTLREKGVKILAKPEGSE